MRYEAGGEDALLAALVPPAGAAAPHSVATIFSAIQPPDVRALRLRIASMVRPRLSKDAGGGGGNKIALMRSVGAARARKKLRLWPRRLPALVLDVPSAERTATLVRDGAADVAHVSVTVADLVKKVRRLVKRGVMTGIISHGFTDNLIARRAERLLIEHVEVSSIPKIETLHKWCELLKITPANICFIGDDINDEEIIKAVGFSACPADAVDVVKNIVNVVLKTKGGEGCVRELIDLYL